MWHVIPDLADRVAHAVLSMPRLRLHVSNQVQDRDAWVKLAHKLRSKWGVYVLFSSGNLRDISSKADPKDSIAFVGTTEEIQHCGIREEEAVNVRVFDSRSVDAMVDVEGFVRGNLVSRYQ
jgi:hypothetical protein